MHAEEYASQEALQIVGAIKDRTVCEFRERGRYDADRWTPKDHADGRKIDALRGVPATPLVLQTDAGDEVLNLHFERGDL